MATSAVINGLGVQGIEDFVTMVAADPRAAAATFVARTEWGGGFRNEARVHGFSLGGARNEASRPRAFTIAGDHPAELLGTNHGPAPVELLLAALGHCLASRWATFGAMLGVEIEALRVEVEGDLDLRGMLALPGAAPTSPGLGSIRACYRVRSAAERGQVERVAALAEERSPTRHSLRAVEFTSRLELER